MLEYGHVPFDQYQRYAVVAHVIRRFVQNSSAPLRVLEVGANSHKLLNRLLPEAEILFLDREVPEELRGDPNVLVGDATALQFPDASFDFVVALDVFEHIPADRRQAFLRETARVADRLAILAAPFDTPGTAAAEAEADALWGELFGASYRWLEEHRVCGLPSVNETEAWLGGEGLAYQRIEHGSLSLWKNMLCAHFAKEYISAAAPIVMAMDDYYNCNIFARDFKTPAYRSFFFYGRTREATVEAVDALRELRGRVWSGQSDGLYESLLSAIPTIAKILCQERKKVNEEAAATHAELERLREQKNAALKEADHWKAAHAIVSDDLGRLRKSLPIRMLEKFLLRKSAIM